MPLLKRVHIGQIKFNSEIRKVVVRGKQNHVMREINDWMFDHLYATGKPIQQLPPLDDWSRSTEDPSVWYLAFPDADWLITIQQELVEF